MHQSVFVVFIALCFLASCSVEHTDLPLPQIDPDSSYILHSDYESTYQATLTTVQKQFPIDRQEKSRGLITTKQQPVPSYFNPKNQPTNYNDINIWIAIHVIKRDNNYSEVNIATELLASDTLYPQKKHNIELEASIRTSLINSICNALHPDSPALCQDIIPAKGWTPPAEQTLPSKETKQRRVVNKEVVTTQKILRSLGYNPGPIDGILGKKTKSALKSLQSDYALQATGVMDEETIQVLLLLSDDDKSNDPAPGNLQISNKPNKDDIVRNPKQHVRPLPLPGILTQPTYLVKSPNIMADGVIEIPRGTILQLIDKKGSFYKTTYRGNMGFIYEGSIKTRDDFKPLYD